MIARARSHRRLAHVVLMCAGVQVGLHVLLVAFGPWPNSLVIGVFAIACAICALEITRGSAVRPWIGMLVLSVAMLVVHALLGHHSGQVVEQSGHHASMTGAVLTELPFGDVVVWAATALAALDALIACVVIASAVRRARVGHPDNRITQEKGGHHAADGVGVS